MRIYGFIAAIVILLGAAAGLLARSGASEAPPRPYQVSERAYDRLVAGATPVSQLTELGFDLARAERLSYLAMIEQFMPNNSTGFDALDPAVQGCLTARDRCSGYAFRLVGRTDAHAVVVIQSGHVAYKSLSGEIRTSAATSLLSSAHN
ncbi:MAG: hypothetical protein ABI450_06275 [Rhizomicrobium sp.]